jgi:hypothetical protein
MKLDVLSAKHFIAEAWRLMTPTKLKNYFVKCSFSNDHVSSNDDSTSEDEHDDWQSLQPQGVQFEGYTTCDSALGYVKHETDIFIINKANISP